MNNDQGVIYVATGELFVKMAAMSAVSVKDHNPGLPVHIFTDCDTASYGCFDSATRISDPHSRSKVDYVSETPYQRTLFLDADTWVCEDITHMFELLDRYDIALSYDDGRARRPKRYAGGPAPKTFQPFNSGVILYKRSDKTLKLFDSWKKTYHKEGRQRDQMSLRNLIWESDIKLWAMPPEYNCRPKGYARVLLNAGITPKILHLDNFKKEAGFPPPTISL
jgi:hypothetical protein